jgi:hypothetical protein
MFVLVLIGHQSLRVERKSLFDVSAQADVPLTICEVLDVVDARCFHSSDPP